jgi:hypothetical protein
MEPVPDDRAAGGRDRSGAGVRGEGRRRAEPANVADPAQDLRRDEQSDPADRQQMRRRGTVKRGGDLALQGPGLPRERAEPGDRRAGERGPDRVGPPCTRCEAPRHYQGGGGGEVSDLFLVARRDHEQQRMQTVPGPGRLRDELVTGIDEELQVRTPHLGGDWRQALLSERDAPHCDGVSPVVFAPAPARAALAHGERGRDVDDHLTRGEQPPRQGHAEAACPFDGDDTLRAHPSDPPCHAIKLPGVRPHGELGNDPAVDIERRCRVASRVRVDPDRDHGLLLPPGAAWTGGDRGHSCR